jgi:hypothetical protein
LRELLLRRYVNNVRIALAARVESLYEVEMDFRFKL